MKSYVRGSLVIVAALGVLCAFLAVARGGGESKVDKGKWMARNEAVYASLHTYPTARLYFSNYWGIPDRVVHNPSDDGPPYSGYVTEHRYRLAKPVSSVAIGDFYTRQLHGWERTPVPSCQWVFTSPKGASINVDACDGDAPMTRAYEMLVNYNQARSIAEAGAHG